MQLPRSLRFDNGWTGGQASLLRAAVGAWLLVDLLLLLRHVGDIAGVARAPGFVDPRALAGLPNVIAIWPTSGTVVAMVVLGAALCLALLVGWRVRAVAVPLWYVWGALFGVARPGWPAGLMLLGWLPLVFALMPPAPYGSLRARGRVDPGAGWQVPAGGFFLAWAGLTALLVVLGAWRMADPAWRGATGTTGMLAVGITSLFLASPLLAAWRPTRPVVWGLSILAELVAISFIGITPAGFLALALHLPTFDPGWIPARRPGRDSGVHPARLFYDGACGLCHRAVRFVLAEDRVGDAFRLAPLDSEAFRASVPADARATLPDSIVVVRPDGGLALRSDAAVEIGARLGGLWRLGAWLLSLVPRPLRDLAYDAVARARHRLFEKPTDACPMVPPALRGRFDA